jgi:hypothetical protein
VFDLGKGTEQSIWWKEQSSRFGEGERWRRKEEREVFEKCWNDAYRKIIMWYENLGQQRGAEMPKIPLTLW